MDVGLLTIIMIASFLVLMALGLPVAFALGTVALFLNIFLWGFKITYVMVSATFDQWTGQTLLALPFFLLMASVLQRSGIGDAAYDMFYKLMGGLKGGLAMGTVIICAIFAAMSGISGAATISMGMIAIPSMIRRKYNKHVVTGAVAAGGLLGIIIPPSIPMILFAVVARESIGSMFMGGIIPGLMLAVFYCTYIFIRSQLNPNIGPPLPPEERASWGEKLASSRAVILPMLIIIGVLGSIYTGFATPTEASAVGAFGAFLSAFINRRYDWKTVILPSLIQALRLSAMCFWILACATFFNNVYIGAGARAFVIDLVTGLELNPWMTIIFMQLSLFIFGMLMDDYAIIILIAPLYAPIAIALGFDGVWFGVLFILNMQIACLTPPYGFNLFYMRGLTHMIRDRIPEEITMMDIYRAVFQFIPMQIVALVLCMVFPQLITWIPSMMMKQV